MSRIRRSKSTVGHSSRASPRGKSTLEDPTRTRETTESNHSGEASPVPDGIDLDRDHLDVCSGTCTRHGERHAAETARDTVHARERKTRNETATYTHVSRPIRRNQSSRSEPVDHSTPIESIV